MTLLAPIPLATVALVAAVCGGLVVVAYILKMRRRRFEVPFSMLWQKILRERETTSLWRHLRRLLSLLLMLVMVGLLLFAATAPRLGDPDQAASSLVLIIDASASMMTRDSGDDGESSRLSAAKKKAHEILGGLGGDDAAMIIKMDGQTTPLSRFEADAAGLHQAIDGIEATATPADLRRALITAGDALRGRAHPRIILIGDGAYPERVLEDVTFEPASSAAARTSAPEKTAPAPAAGAGAGAGAGNLAAIDLSGIDVRFFPVGSATANAGIVAFSARRYIANKMAFEVLVEVENFGKKPVKRKLVLSSGEGEASTTVDVKLLELAAGQRVRQIYKDLPSGTDTRLRATLEVPDGDPADSFPLDDTAFALVPARRRQHVLLVTDDNLYLEAAMLVYDNIQVDKLTGDDYDAAVGKGELPTYDAIVFDGITPAKLPPHTNLIYFDPQGENSPLSIRKTLTAPRITHIASHPVMRWLTLSDVNFDKASVFRIDPDAGEVALARSLEAPIIAAKQTAGGRKIVAFGFSLGGTDLMLRVAFPLVLVNSLDWFAGQGSDMMATYETGQTARIPVDGEVHADGAIITEPGGETFQVPVTVGRAGFYARTVGIHELSVTEHGTPVATLELAANLANPEESAIAPRAELVMGGRTLAAPGGTIVSHRQSLWRYLVCVAVLFLCIEWVTYNRRITL